jgi:TRAP-type C4-dicarboxylate transport system permease small subunit
VGVLVGFLVLLSGYIIKSPQVKTTELGIFIFSALAAIAAFYTGEGAEEIIENLPGVSETLIHKHEELAELFFTMMLVLGGSSLLTLFFQFKKFPFVKYGFVLVLLISISCIVISIYVGKSGGEITHIEIRNDTNVIQLNSHDGDDD